MDTRQITSGLRWLAVFSLVLGGLLMPVMGGEAQVNTGATLTVLRGNIGVLRADGTPIAPGTSGLALGVGDQISTLANSGALVTFFEGSEVELGSNTTIVITEASGQGSRANISIANMVGATVHRVVTLTDPGSSYKVEAGGTVALVRGTVFGHFVDPNGTVVVALQRCDAPPGASEQKRTACLEFPFENSLVSVGTKVTYTPRGNRIEEPFRLSESLFNVITELPTDELGTENPGFNTGSRTFPQQTSLRPTEKDRAGCPEPVPGRTELIAPAPAGSTELQVCPPLGFSVGDTIRINPGGSPSETAVISGFGSILLTAGTSNSYGTGTAIVLERQATTPTSTSTSTVTPTATGTLAPTSTDTLTPTSTSTATSTPTPTSTPDVIVSISSVGNPNPIVEPAGGATAPMTFTVSLSRVFDQSVTVRYDTVNSTAVGGAPCGAAAPTNDYLNVVNGSVTIPAGANPPSQDLAITICGHDGSVADALTEQFFVDISNPTNGAILGNARGTGAIRDRPIISITDVSQFEGDTGTSSFTFGVTLSHSSTQTVTVDFATANGPPGQATAPSDYLSTSGTLTFIPGDISEPINVTVNGDTTGEEGDEFFVVNLSNPTNASFGDNQATGTIQDDDDILLGRSVENPVHRAAP